MEYPINTAGHGLVVVQLLGLSGVAEEAGSYEAAYHAAMAALHVADHAGELEEVERVRNFQVHADAIRSRLSARAHFNRRRAGSLDA